MPAFLKSLLLSLLAVLLIALGAVDPAPAAGPVVVASKIDTEGALLGNMIVDVLEAHGVPVERKIQLGPTNIVRAAILAGQIDIYPEYTGNGGLFFHRETDPGVEGRRRGLCRRSSRSTPRRTVSSGSPPAPANNTWVIAIRRDLPGLRQRRCLGDLAAIWPAAASSSSPPRPSSSRARRRLPAFEKTYGFHLKIGPVVDAVGRQHRGDVARPRPRASPGSTRRWPTAPTARLAALGLVALCDDKGAQIVYAPAPVLREAVLPSIPQIAACSIRCSPADARTLQELNARIAVGGEDAGGGGARLPEIAAFPAVTVAVAEELPARGVAGRVGNPGPAGAGHRRRDRGAGGRLCDNRAEPAGVRPSGDVVAGCRRAAAAGIAAARRRLLLRGLAAAAARLAHCGAPSLAAALLLLGLAAAGNAASALAAAGRGWRGSRSAPAFWYLLAARALAIVDALQRAERRPGDALCGRSPCLPAAFVLMCRAGTVRRAVDRPRIRDPARACLPRALVRHVLLVARSVGPAVVDRLSARDRRGAPPRLQGPLFAVLNTVADGPLDRAVRIVDRAALGAGGGAAPALAALGIGGIGAGAGDRSRWCSMRCCRSCATRRPGSAGSIRPSIEAGARHGHDRGGRSSGRSSCRSPRRCCSPGCASSPCRRSGSRSSPR